MGGKGEGSWGGGGQGRGRGGGRGQVALTLNSRYAQPRLQLSKLFLMDVKLY